LPRRDPTRRRADPHQRGEHRNAEVFRAAATTNRFSSWTVMVASGVSAAGSPSGKTPLDATLVFAALGLAIVVVGYRVRK